LVSTAEARVEIRAELSLVRQIAAALAAQLAPLAERRTEFETLQAVCSVSAEQGRRRLGAMMARWAPGLFAGEEPLERQAEGGAEVSPLPEDNYALERFFRVPKHHARHIHGRRHAGMAIVVHGPTLMLVLDAHLHHPAPFTAAELRPYRTASVPRTQREALQRAQVMRKARSATRRPELLAELEARYLGGKV
jgi:hypothetical protein